MTRNDNLAEAGTLKERIRQHVDETDKLLADAKEALRWSKTRRKPRLYITAEGEDKPIKA